ncbi:phage head closure protein [Exiguobacterium oxidotolerans]|uniref:phage head closure protein n=1 Tax=Exiguobacterium oxidotolerans TaxID=223958 RepID=UPI0004945720|nr:phage head closure protein [Exiguobacterium oxidotolerans]
MFDFRPHEIALVFPSTGGSYDEAGSYIPGDSPPDEVIDAHVDVLSGSEYERAQKVAADTNVIIYIDYRDDLDERIKVRHKGKTYSVSALISQGGLDETLALYAKEVE